MKKVLCISGVLVVLFLMMVDSASAQTWYPANKVTLAWDSVPIPNCVCSTPPCTPTTICPGPTYPSPAAGVVKYQVYSRGDLVSLGDKVGGEITATQLLVSFTSMGKYYLGIESIVYYQGETVGIKSATKAWSSVAADTNNNPFGVSFFFAPTIPGGLRLIP
jgi:hypothetical protein